MGGGIFQKVVAKMRQEQKAKAKHDLPITKKPKPIVKPKPKAKDDSEVQKLLDWAKNNKPDEGWITNNKMKEIKLRKGYFEKNIDKRMSWIDYLASKEKKGVIRIVKKSVIKTVKDTLSTKKINHEVLPVKIFFNDETDPMYTFNYEFYGDFEKNALLKFIEREIWSKHFASTYGSYEKYNVKVDI